MGMRHKRLGEKQDFCNEEQFIEQVFEDRNFISHSKY
jgi:hypothetical protein